MNALLSFIHHRLTQLAARHLILTLGALALACLAPACKGGGGGGGGSDPMKGEGELAQSPGNDELGKAPSTLIPEGYQSATLTIGHSMATLNLSCSAPGGSPGDAWSGDVNSGTLVIDDTSYTGETTKSSVQGTWEQVDFNTCDTIQNLALNCSTNGGTGTLLVTGLAMKIRSRHADAENGSIHLTGTVAGGELKWSNSGVLTDSFKIADLKDANFELKILKD